ncbi:MAG TPA: hypothetical protein VMF09_07820 [Solirubrobacteraceae bacterium]|nr:hypothetical protein [Solirubrobacteraceae bacterium]
MERKNRIRSMVLSMTLVATLGLCAGALLPAVAAAATGTIQGEVKEYKETASVHEPIKGICVTATPMGGSETLGFAETNSAGEYEISGLAEAEYQVSFRDCFGSTLNFAPRFYPEKPKESEAVLVDLHGGETKSGIDALMHAGGEIYEGGALGGKGQKLKGVCVEALPTTEGEGGFTTTNAEGEATITGLPTGEYVVEFGSCGGDVVPAVYEESNAPSFVTHSYAHATHVKVTAEVEPAVPLEIANVTLEAGAEIEGTLTNAEGRPVSASICVGAEPTSGSGGELGEEAYTSTSEGHYEIEGLATGTYRLHFEQCHETGESVEWASQYYDGAATAAEATPISVTSGEEPAVPALANVKLLRSSAIKPANTAAPALSGTPVVGDTLSCSTGTWTGTPTPTYSYQWLREGAAISGASAGSYTVQGADEGHSLSCTVTASNEAGSASATSGALGVSKTTTSTTTTSTTTTSTTTTSGTARASGSATVKHGTAMVKLTCNAAGPCKGTIKLVARVTEKHYVKHHEVKRTRNVVIGTASVSIEKGASKTIHVRLTGEGQVLLRKAGKKGLEVNVSGSGIKGGTLVLKETKAHGKH